MKRTIIIMTLIGFTFLSCKKNSIEKIDNRNFKMGFSTWSYGPNLEDREINYELIKENGDIYSEQIDDLIPWNAWINGTTLPTNFVEDIDYRVSKMSSLNQVVLSISPLNTDRSDFIGDWNGSGTPSYTSLNDSTL